MSFRPSDGKTRPAFWELFPARGNLTLLFGKIAVVRKKYMK